MAQDHIPKNQVTSRNTIEQAQHEEDAAAKRVVKVDADGEFVDSDNPDSTYVSFIRDGQPQQVVEDTATPANNRPLPVKLTGFDGDVIINSENLNLETQLDGVYDPSANPVPDTVGVIAHERGVTQDKTSQTARTTAKRGTTDTDVVSLDVSLHDHDGNGYTPANQLPVTDQTTHDKLDQVHTDLGTIDSDLNSFAAQNHTDLVAVDNDVNSFKSQNHTDLLNVEGKQDVGNASLASIDSKLTTTNTEIGALNETAPVTDVASSGLNGRLQRIAQRLTTVDADLNSFAAANHSDLASIKSDIDSSNAKLDILHADNLVIEGKLDTLHSDLVTVEGKQDVGNASLSSIDSKLSTTNTEIGGLTETAPATDTASSGLNGRLQRIAQRLTTVDADLNSFASANHADLLSIKADIDSTNTKLDTLHADLVVVEGKQDVGNASLASIDSKLSTTNTEIGALNETAPASDTASSGLNGRLQRVAQNITNLDTDVKSVQGTTGSAVPGKADYVSGRDPAGNLRGLRTSELGAESIDGIYDASNNTDPSNVGVILQTRNAAYSDTRQVERPTAKRGAADTDTVSQDVSLHDKDGDGITSDKNGGSHVAFKAVVDSNNLASGTVIPAYLGTPLENLITVGSALPAIPADTFNPAGWTSVKDYAVLAFDVRSSALGKGFAVWSDNGGTTVSRYESTLFSGSGAFSDPPQGATHLKVLFQNLSVGTNTFFLNTILKYQAQGQFMAPINAPLDPSFPAAVTKAILVGQKPDSSFDNVRLQGQEPGNSTSTPLNASVTYRGTWFKWQETYLKLGISVNSDVAGSLWIDFSEATTPTNGDDSSVYSSFFYAYDPTVESLFREQVPVQSKWVRVRYLNGIAAQSVFTFNTILLTTDPGSAALQLKTLPVRGQVASIVRNIPALLNAAGTALQEVPISTLGNPKQSIAEIHDDVLIEPLATAKATQTVVGITAVQVDASPLSNRRVVNVTNDGPGRIAIGHSSGITFDSLSIRIPTGASRTFGIDENIPLWAIVENLGGAQATFHRSPGAATGTATNPTNATSSNNVYANITAAAQNINANTFTAGTANPLVAVRLGIEGNKQASQVETVAFVDNVTGNAANVGSVSTTSSVTHAVGHVYLAAVSRENGSAVVTGVAGLGLTWTQVGTQANGTSRAIDVWYAVGNGTTGGTVTASFDRNATNSHIAVSRYSNVDPNAPIQAFAVATGNSTTPAVAAIACTNKGMSFLATCMDNHTFSAGSGYTLISTETTAAGASRDGLGTERKAITVTGTETPTGTIDSGVQWAALGLTLTPKPAVDPIVTLSYTLSAVAGATSGNVTFTLSSDQSFTIDVTGDRSWVVGDIVNVAVIATGLTIGAAAANIDEIYLELVDSTGSSSRVSVWQGGKAVS